MWWRTLGGGQQEDHTLKVISGSKEIKEKESQNLETSRNTQLCHRVNWEVFSLGDVHPGHPRNPSQAVSMAEKGEGRKEIHQANEGRLVWEVTQGTYREGR